MSNKVVDEVSKANLSPVELENLDEVPLNFVIYIFIFFKLNSLKIGWMGYFNDNCVTWKLRTNWSPWRPSFIYTR